MLISSFIISDINRLWGYDFFARGMQMNITARFGREVRKKRKLLNISQEDLAGMSGLDRSHMGQIERGGKSPSLITIDRIAHALGCLPSDLLVND